MASSLLAGMEPVAGSQHPLASMGSGDGAVVRPFDGGDGGDSDSGGAGAGSGGFGGGSGGGGGRDGDGGGEGGRAAVGTDVLLDEEESTNMVMELVNPSSPPLTVNVYVAEGVGSIKWSFRTQGKGILFSVRRGDESILPSMEVPSDQMQIEGAEWVAPCHLWCPLVSSGVLWCPPVSSGVFWCPLVCSLRTPREQILWHRVRV